MLGIEMVLTTEWSQVEVVDLINNGNGLGFNIVGGKSTGVVIKYIHPGGVADKDGRLQGGDHVLQIGDVNLRGYSSEQVASVLRQAGSHVRLLVARPIDPASIDYKRFNVNAPIVPTKVLTDPDLLAQHLLENNTQPYNVLPQGYSEHLHPYSVEHLNEQVTDINLSKTSKLIEQDIYNESTNILITPTSLPDLPEREMINVKLSKNVYGLGITVAGYVCEQEELCGIFVRSIIEGSCADLSGRVQVNDRIIEVDGINLADKTNHEAVEILKNTGIDVELILERYLRGPKFDHLQIALSNSCQTASPPTSPSISTLTWIAVPSYTSTEIEPEGESITTIDSNIFGAESDPSPQEIDEKLDEALQKNHENILEHWKSEIGSEKLVVIAEVQKLSGLGISLEGTVEVEGGQEVRPHHYIRSILPEGPVGQQGQLMAGDELLQINDEVLHGLKHTDVVNIIKNLPNKVTLVCARNNSDSGPRPVINISQDREAFETRKIISGSIQNLSSLIKSLSDSSINTSNTSTLTNNSLKSKKSRSLECVTGLAMWQSREEIIELVKGDSGLGFSILDYQDPVNADGIVIVVRSLVPGGVAEEQGGISPGDRVMTVNGANIRNATLDQAVQALKGAPKGIVKVGVAKPFSAKESKTSKASSRKSS